MSLSSNVRATLRRPSTQALVAVGDVRTAGTCNGSAARFVSGQCLQQRCSSITTSGRGNLAHNRMRWRNNFQKDSHRFISKDVTLRNRAFIALGSNMGDRVAMIEQACKEMEATGKLKIIRTSSLYETKAMYVLDQDNFVNGACEIATSLEPLELLDFLQSIENKLGRVKVIDKGPRNIDLDILLYSRKIMGVQEIVLWNDERLILPHKLMFEREFVLRPLHEIIPDREDFMVQYSPQKESFKSFITRELDLLKSSEPLSSLTRLGSNLPNITPNRSCQSTRIMSILNATPDSFSDGGKHYNLDNESLKAAILQHVKDGATIIDVGGQSTRPGSPQSSSQEELSRVLPAIEFIHSLNLPGIAISVDTYRADVAEAAVKAGAHIINDVSAGLMDENMLHTAARLDATICLMHMRGTPETMSTLTSYPNGLISTVGAELLERVEAAERAGIRRWRMILDPGIGFAKTQEQNLELLRHFEQLRRYPGLKNLPWLVGTSRKKFIGDITGVREARERTWGTAATVAAAVWGGADVVRVHDVKEMADVAKMADAIWRL